MSYTELYKFTNDGTAKCFAEVHNSFRSGMAIWQTIETRYLPKYIPSWANGDESREYFRSFVSSGDAVKEVWALFDGDKISKIDKIVLGTTFNNVIVMKLDIPRLIEAFRSFEGETSLKEQADLIEAAFKSDEDLIAIAWNQTSVTADAWKSTELREGEEYYIPYNLLKHDKHWNLFEEI